MASNTATSFLRIASVARDCSNFSLNAAISARCFFRSRLYWSDDVEPEGRWGPSMNNYLLLPWIIESMKLSHSG